MRTVIGDPDAYLERSNTGHSIGSGNGSGAGNYRGQNDASGNNFDNGTGHVNLKGEWVFVEYDKIRHVVKMFDRKVTACGLEVFSYEEWACITNSNKVTNSEPEDVNCMVCLAG